MSENSEPIAAAQEIPVPLSHRRILRIMAIVVITVAISSSFFVSQRFGLGLFIGGVLSFLNYYWLKISLKKIFNKVIGGDRPRFLALYYFPRYLAIGASLAIIYFTEVVSFTAVLLGLSAFALAIVIEGVILLFLSISKREEF